MCKKTTILTALLVVISVASVSFAGPQCNSVNKDCRKWKLGIQTHTFNRFTFYEAIDKTARLSLDYIEAYPGQIISKDKPNVKFGPDMSTQLREEIKQLLKEARVKLVNTYVVKLPNDEAKCRKIFDFAKDMGIEALVCEPPEEALDLIDKLCQEYKIKVAIHNHPKHSKLQRYWHPDKVLKACQGRSKWIGVCADTGHWMRSGVNPVEALKKLEGRIISLHLKDLNKFDDKEAHDVIWGTGKADVKAIMAELNRQNFDGLFTIEYEHNWENSSPEIRECIAYFDRQAAQLNKANWRWLYNDKDTAGWELITKHKGSWLAKNGLLYNEGFSGNWLSTTKEYSNFKLEFEFKSPPHANSGVFLRAPRVGKTSHEGIKIPILDDHIPRFADYPPDHFTGSIYGLQAPSKRVSKKSQKWQKMLIVCDGPKVQITLNGTQIIDANLNDYMDKADEFPGIKRRKGYIGMDNHGLAVSYRNIRIMQLKQ